VTALADAGKSPLEVAPSRFTALPRAIILVRIANPDTLALHHARAMLAGVRGMRVLTEPAIKVNALGMSSVADVVIAELGDTNSCARSAIRELSRGEARTCVLLMSARRDSDWIRAVFDAGAAGIISANASREALIVAVRAVATGQVVLPRRVFTAVVAQLPPPHPRDGTSVHALRGATLGGAKHGLARLTGRERSVFQMTAEGYSAPEVGARLSISKKTVETYKRRIGEKLGLSHRTDYVRVALENEVLIAPQVLTAGEA
jgi:DNA-binding NarL/FixJ family response regulator